MSTGTIKLVEYKSLVKDIAKCTKCDKYKMKDKNGEIIELKHHLSRVHINLWAHWQGNLNAKILLIGQDWGRLDGDEEAEYYRQRNPYLITDRHSKEYSPTDNNLRTLFLEAFHIDILEPSDYLFFTNSIQCYKTGSLSNKTNDNWYRICNKEYVKRLIGIIKPKVIIPVGTKALNGLRMCGDFYNPENKMVSNTYFKQKFVDIVESGHLKLKISIENQTTEVMVYPVFHYGVLSCNLNRKFEKQLEDWRKIAKIVE
jgi:uracil-DNA glycosylase